MVSNVAVISDIHGVLPALERVLAEPAVAEAELIVVTGDHTWGPQPTEVLDRLTALGDRAVLVRGNADRELLEESQGPDGGSDADPLTVWGAARLSPRHQDLLERMPEQVTIDVEGFGRVRFCHATPRSDEEVVLVDTRVERWVEVLADLPDDVRTMVCGHSHMPFTRLVDGRLVVNPGSVGLPYGRTGAHWALLSLGAVTLGCAEIDTADLIRQVVAASDFPEVRAWTEEYLRSPATDLEAISAFGPRDGRSRAPGEKTPTASSPAAEEMVAVLDESNAVIGAATRSVVRAQNLRHACVTVLVFSSEGHVYVHRRTDTKDVYPGAYDMMAGGVLQVGEDPSAAAAREAEEELGVTGVDLVPLAEADYADDRSQYHAYGYTTTYDGPIRWQPEEVAWGTWVSRDELLAMLEDPEYSFAPDTLAFLRRWMNEGLLWGDR